MSKNKINPDPSRRLFSEPQADLFERSHEEEMAAKAEEPVECLGLTFANDEERRQYFLDILREKLKDPEFRKIEGCPIASAGIPRLSSVSLFPPRPAQLPSHSPIPVFRSTAQAG